MLETCTDLSTPLMADACLRCDVPLRVAPSGIRAVVAGWRIAGRVLPVRHYGSVDVFLEAFGRAGAGDVLVIDNGGRLDEACVGDLAVLEAEAAGVAGLVVWGFRTWSAPGMSCSPMTTACCSSRRSAPSRCWSPRVRSGRPSGTRPAGSGIGNCGSRGCRPVRRRPRGYSLLSS